MTAATAAAIVAVVPALLVLGPEALALALSNPAAAVNAGIITVETAAAIATNSVTPGVVVEGGAAKVGSAANSAGSLIPGFNATESGIIGEAQSILNSPQIAEIQNAYQASQPVTLNIGGRILQYEPNLPASGMTMFGENGFLIGPEAFSSSDEFQ